MRLASRLGAGYFDNMMKPILAERTVRRFDKPSVGFGVRPSDKPGVAMQTLSQRVCGSLDARPLMKQQGGTLVAVYGPQAKSYQAVLPLDIRRMLRGNKGKDGKAETPAIPTFGLARKTAFAIVRECDARALATGRNITAILRDPVIMRAIGEQRLGLMPKPKLTPDQAMLEFGPEEVLTLANLTPKPLGQSLMALAVLQGIAPGLLQDGVSRWLNALKKRGILRRPSASSLWQFNTARVSRDIFTLDTLPKGSFTITRESKAILDGIKARAQAAKAECQAHARRTKLALSFLDKSRKSLQAWAASWEAHHARMVCADRHFPIFSEIQAAKRMSIAKRPTSGRMGLAHAILYRARQLSEAYHAVRGERFALDLVTERKPREAYTCPLWKYGGKLGKADKLRLKGLAAFCRKVAEYLDSIEFKSWVKIQGRPRLEHVNESDVDFVPCQIQGPAVGPVMPRPQNKSVVGPGTFPDRDVRKGRLCTSCGLPFKAIREKREAGLRVQVVGQRPVWGQTSALVAENGVMVRRDIQAIIGSTPIVAELPRFEYETIVKACSCPKARHARPIPDRPKKGNVLRWDAVSLRWYEVPKGTKTDDAKTLARLAKVTRQGSELVTKVTSEGKTALASLQEIVADKAVMAGFSPAKQRRLKRLARKG